MNISQLNNISSLKLNSNQIDKKVSSSNNKTFEDLFQSALGVVKETNDLTVAAKEAEVSYALGLTDNVLDLQVAQTKANTALQYTVAIRNKVLEAYREIMNLQF